MDILVSALTGLTLGLAGAASPGPDTVLVVRGVLARGRAAGFRVAAGVACGLACHAAASLAAAAAVGRFATALAALQMAGAAYLVYLGVRLLRSHAGGAGTSEKAENTTDFFRQGFLTNLLNAKVAVFFTAVATPFLRTDAFAPAAALLAGIIAAAFAWFCGLSVAVALAGRAARPVHLRWVDRIAGVAFLLLAAAAAVTAVHTATA